MDKPCDLVSSKGYKRQERLHWQAQHWGKGSVTVTSEQGRARVEEEESREDFVERTFQRTLVETFGELKNLKIKAKITFQSVPSSSCNFNSSLEVRVMHFLQRENKATHLIPHCFTVRY